MVKKCQLEGCQKKPTYGIFGQDPTHCTKHKLDGMIDLIHKLCVINDCFKRALFGLPGGKPEYCGNHKPEGHVNNDNKNKCSHEDCTKQPVFGYPNEKSSRCVTHKLDGMIDTRNKHCVYPECNVLPSYGMIGEQPSHCVTHRLEGMVNVKGRKCLHDGCNTKPTFGHAGEQPTYCVKHKSNDMIDVFNKRCQHPHCDKQPSYGLPDGKAVFCTAHRQEGMVDTKNIYCDYPDCRKYASFGLEDEKPSKCSSHKLEGMVNVVSKYCVTPLCGTIVSNKTYKGYCTRCYYYMFPNESIVRNFKNKENAVAKYIVDQFPQYDIVLDKIVEGGCSKKRPDILIDVLTHWVVVEIDENQHSNYDTTCEHRRMMELFQDLGQMNIVFIRFNPDSYTVCNGSVRVPSSWCIDGRGVCKIDPDLLHLWEHRLEWLKYKVNFWLNHIPEKTITVEHLYYDS